jgi:hypothetical protein
MKRFRIFFLVSALAANLCAVSGAPQPQEAAKTAQSATNSAPAQAIAKAPAAKPVDAISWVVGGVWTADATKMAPGMQKIETRYLWSDNHAYIRFNTHFVFEKGTARAYDGNLFWNSDKKSLAIWYMDHESSITEGPLRVDADGWTITFHGPDFEGNPADLRVKVLRKTNDDYQWSVAEKQGDTWKQLAQLEYFRQPGN